MRTGAVVNAPDFSFTHYSTENGLPSNSIRDIAQDNDGFIWFATDGGLVRFDGVSSKVFVPGKEDGEGDVFMHSLCNSAQGMLVGSDEHLYLYNPAMESLSLLELTYAPEVKERMEGQVEDICVDSSGNIWVSVQGRGVFRISSDHKVVSHQYFPDVNNFIGMLYIDSSDVVWGVSTINSGGVYRLGKDGNFERFNITVEGAPLPVGGLAMVCDTHGDYWLGTWERGLIRFNGRTGEGVAVIAPENVDKMWHIHSVTEYSPGQLLVGSDSGLTLVDRLTGECTVYKSDELSMQSLSDRFVYPVTIDAEGGVWIGTYYRGVNYLSRDYKRFQRWYHSRFANSISGNVVARLCEDSKGNVWIGSADGGLCRYNPSTGIFTHFPLGRSCDNDNVNALWADGDSLWVGTYSKGAGKMNMNTGVWTPIAAEGKNNYSCYAICKSQDGTVWMASTGTLTRYVEERGTFEKFDEFGAWITDIDEDRDGMLWISTQGRGLFKVNPATGERVNYVASKAPGSLPHNHINSVTVADGRVYVATIYGLYQYDAAKDNFTKIKVGPGEPAIQSVEMAGTDMWIATQSGLIRMKENGEGRLFTYADGLSDNQFVPGASLHASDGHLYYGTVHGFCRVDPMAARSNAAPPKMRFTGLEIVNRQVDVGDARLPESLNVIDKLILTGADHTFSVYFSALSYSNPGGNRYKYRLEGFDKSWRDTGKENRATYSNLPPGDYVLKVKAANGDGVWNEEGIALRIVVKPAWYASALMKALYVIIGVVVLLLGVRYVLWRMQRNHIIELDRISSNKEKEMFRSKLNFFTVVAHEIRTPVSLIIGPLEKILDSSERFTPSVKEDLKVIDRNARRLLSLVNQLLDFKKVEDNALPVGFRHEKVMPLLTNVTDRFRPSLQQKGVTLSVDCTDPELTADIDPEAVTKLISNLLNNARKFTKTEIRVECRKEGTDKLMIRVEDDGIGIGKEHRDKIFKPFFQVLDNINEARGGTGLGLSIVKSVVDAHHGTVEVDSAPGKGARFTVLLPLHQDNVVPAESVPAGSEDSVEETAQEEVRNDKRPVLLVVDDNEEMVGFIANCFEKHYDVLTAVNGRDALEKMRTATVSLIICDWMMPVMDGVEFLKTIRRDENYCHIPFVMLTAKTDNTSKVETMKSGADIYVEKPFSTSYLEACIGNLLEMREVLHKKFSESPLEPLSSLAKTDVDNCLLGKMQTLIEENFSNPELNVDFLADRLGISRSGLYAKIRSLANVTPNELIQLTRLKRAAQLLKEGKYRVNEICYMVGFNSNSYFTRCFFKQFGVNPGEFAGKQDEKGGE